MVWFFQLVFGLSSARQLWPDIRRHLCCSLLFFKVQLECSKDSMKTGTLVWNITTLHKANKIKSIFGATSQYGRAVRLTFWLLLQNVLGFVNCKYKFLVLIASYAVFGYDWNLSLVLPWSVIFYPAMLFLMPSTPLTQVWTRNGSCIYSLQLHCEITMPSSKSQESVYIFGSPHPL